MVSETLWQDVSALPVADRLDLARRIAASIPQVPATDLTALTTAELRALLDDSDREMDAHPEDVTPGHLLTASIRTKLGL